MAPFPNVRVRRGRGGRRLAQVDDVVAAVRRGADVADCGDQDPVHERGRGCSLGRVHGQHVRAETVWKGHRPRELALLQLDRVEDKASKLDHHDLNKGTTSQSEGDKARRGQGVARGHGG